MQISKLAGFGVSNGVIEVLKQEGLEELYPPQEEALLQGLLELDSSFVIAVPTASGKTLAAELLMTKSILEENGKCLYIVPLRALASEKYQEFLKYQNLGIKVGISTGEYDSSDSWLQGSDIIITTSEKADSLLRHRSDWLNSLSVVVADEIHLMNDAKRGPTLEVTLARLLHLNPNLLIMGLSATIQNADEIADWLDAKLITSDWRPVTLVEGVYFDRELLFSNSRMVDVETITKDVPINLAAEVVKNGGQCLVFVNTRRCAERYAENASTVLKKLLSKAEKETLKKLSNEVLRVLPEPTRICKRLSMCLKGGAAFHHAGLATGQRKIVEEAFKKDRIKVISATPTLAAGVNLPARRVVIRDYHRYDPNLGRKEIMVLEYKQMAGRAGRPKYDDYGEAVLIAKTGEERDHLLDNFILAGPERIYSKLAVEATLRTHVLATIATGFANSYHGLLEFFSKTFFAYQQDPATLELVIVPIIEFLEGEGFIYEKEDRLVPTAFGKRTSELYIDPMTAVIMRNAVKRAQEKETSEISYLHAISRSLELGSLYLRRKDYDFLNEEFSQSLPFLLFDSPEELYESWRYEEFLAEFKTALFLNSWIEEESDEEILEKFNLGPGDIRTKVDISNWLLYSMSEIGRLFKLKKLNEVRRLRERVRHGIKEELLEIISLKDVGRVRARGLFNAGFKSFDSLKKAEISDLSKVKGIGTKLATSIKDQLE
ncbi:MAG: DEAD/DEAH box helicase [Candidatus Hydrothermarchaeales archaeon]